MVLIWIIAILCVLGGFAMIATGFYLSQNPVGVRKQLHDGVQQATNLVSQGLDTLNRSRAMAPGGAGFPPAEPQLAPPAAADLSSAAAPGLAVPLPEAQAASVATGLANQAADFVNALATLAKNLSGLDPAIAAYVISVILFAFATVLAAIDRLA